LLCVKIGKEIQKRPVVVGLRSDLAAEIKNGVKEGELIVRDPRGLVRRLRPFLGPPAGEDAKAPQRMEKLIRVSSFNPVEDSQSRRTRIQSYGLTFKDLDIISALPGVSQVLPVRRLPQETRYLDRVTNCAVVATTPEYAMLGHIHVDRGRFLSASDFRQKKNVVVLGAAVADGLFPDGNAMGKDVVIARHGYTVIGVVDANEREDGLPVEVVDNCVYLPLSTYQVRFGKRVLIRRSGSFSGEAVQLNDIYLTTLAEDLTTIMDNIRTILEENHAKKDWKIEAE
jgi:putative ABC transport system permease protein